MALYSYGPQAYSYGPIQLWPYIVMALYSYGPQAAFNEFAVDDFVRGFRDPAQRQDDRMLKLKDWPPDDEFKNVYEDAYKVFRHVCNQLAPGYTAPDGDFNFTKYFPKTHVPPDVGPKTYIAYGGKMGPKGNPLGGHTCLHLGMSDAFNVLVDTQSERAWEGVEQVCYRHLAHQALPIAHWMGGRTGKI